MTDTTYMQKETMRGMGTGMMKKPRPIDAQPEPDAEYTSSDMRCANCEHFDGMEKCEKGVNGGSVEPMGHCKMFEAGEAEESDGEEMHEGEEE